MQICMQLVAAGSLSLCGLAASRMKIKARCTLHPCDSHIGSICMQQLFDLKNEDTNKNCKFNTTLELASSYLLTTSIVPSKLMS